MSVFADIMSPYWFGFKMLVLSLVIMLVVGYVAYLHVEISSIQKEVTRLEGVISECQNKAKDLTIQNEQQAANLVKLQEYYRTKKCLDLKNGELTDEELQFR